MSDGLPSAPQPESRPLHERELRLLLALVPTGAAGSAFKAELAMAQVRPMADGGMGSLRFLYPDVEAMGAEVATAVYTDEDGTPVELSVNVDRRGRLFELDIWRVDFRPLQRYPEPSQLELGEP